MSVTPRHFPSPESGHAPTVRRALWLLPLVSLIGICLPTQTQAAAPYCVSTGSVQLDFGTVTSTSYRDAETAIQISCTGSTSNLITPAAVRACVFIGEGTPSGMAPRRMTDGNGAYMRYDLYGDPGRSRLIGPRGSRHPVHSITFSLNPRQIRQLSIPIYGRAPAGQSLPATSAYKGVPYGSVVRYSYGLLHTPLENECRDGIAGHLGGTGETAVGWSGVNARMANTCKITTATDLDFGTVSGLPVALEQTSVITLKCATNATWRVTLNNGTNALAGARTMTSGSARIGYELYRDAARLERWGSTVATGVSGTSAEQSLTVYGRIPALADTVPGNYRDVVTVTLTY